MSRSKLCAVLAAAVIVLGVLSPAHSSDLLVSSRNTNQVLRYNGTTGVPMFYRNTGNDIGNVIQTLDAGDDAGNFTTLGTEWASCFGGKAGCPDAIAGCTFADCGVTHSLAEIVDLATFRLAAGSPAIGAGAGSLFHSGFERVPAGDFEGDPRPDLPDLPAIGFDERP
jgi:hypothetical protein